MRFVPGALVPREVSGGGISASWYNVTENVNASCVASEADVDFPGERDSWERRRGIRNFLGNARDGVVGKF